LNFSLYTFYRHGWDKCHQ